VSDPRDRPPEAPLPGGLIGLIVRPFQALVLGAIRLAFGLVEGLIAALLSPLTGGPPQAEPPQADQPPADPSPGGGSSHDLDDHSSR